MIEEKKDREVVESLGNEFLDADIAVTV